MSKKLLIIGGLILFLLLAYLLKRLFFPSAPLSPIAPSSFHAISFNSIDQENISLSNYKKKVFLIVNVASKCGYTPQYKGLQTLHETYHQKGLVVIGFPSNDFLNQEPGTSEDIKTFCSTQYNVSFLLAEKGQVKKGRHQHPLYRYLTGKDTNPNFGGSISWNFNKFLVGQNGQVIARFDSKIGPLNQRVVTSIEEALNTSPSTSF